MGQRAGVGGVVAVVREPPRLPLEALETPAVRGDPQDAVPVHEEAADRIVAEA